MMKTTEDIYIYIYIIKAEKLLKLWRMQQLTIEGKILIFKTLAISNVAHLALGTYVPSAAIAQLKKIPKTIYLEK